MRAKRTTILSCSWTSPLEVGMVFVYANIFFWISEGIVDPLVKTKEPMKPQFGWIKYQYVSKHLAPYLINFEASI